MVTGVPMLITMIPTAIKRFRLGLVNFMSLQREVYSWLLETVAGYWRLYSVGYCRSRTAVHNVKTLDI